MSQLRSNLFLHIHGRDLWSLVPGGVPTSDLYRSDWSERLVNPDIQRIHIVGCRENIPLIVEVMSRGFSAQLMLASPVDIKHDSPEKSLLAAMASHKPAHQGGWHQATDDDRRMYEVYRFEVAGEDCPKDVYEYHPAWPVLDFLGVEASVGVTILTEVIDPRWFVHPTRPDRLSRLCLFFGLGSKFAKVGINPTHPRWKRSELIYRAWSLASNPYFSRIYDQYCERMDSAMAVMRTGQRFIQLLHVVWMASLTRHPESFVPKYYFRDGLDAMAYEEHRRKWDETHSSLSGTNRG